MESTLKDQQKREAKLRNAQRKGQAVGAIAGAGALTAGAYALGENIRKHPDDYADCTKDYFSSGSSSGSSSENIMTDATDGESKFKTFVRPVFNSTILMSISTGLRYTVNNIIGSLASGGITSSWATLLAPVGYGAFGAATIWGVGKVVGFAHKKYKENQYKKQQRKEIAMENEMASARSQEKGNSVVVNNATAMENVAMASQLTSSSFF